MEWNVDEAEDFVDVGGDFVTNVDAAGVESVGVASLVIAAISACGITTKKIAVTAAVVVGDAINAVKDVGQKLRAEDGTSETLITFSIYLFTTGVICSSN